MTGPESRQVRRARERREASPANHREQRPVSRAERRAKRPDDKAIIIRPTRLNAVASCKRTRRDYRIRKGLRPARGMVHPRTISERRYIAIRMTQLVFAIAAKRADDRRAAVAAAIAASQ